MNEIQNFVNVALATDAGGEGDLSHDNLSGLRTVGSGFASLIYLPKYAGFNELKVACAYIWDALEKKPNLPQLLVSQYKISILLGVHFNELLGKCLDQILTAMYSMRPSNLYMPIRACVLTNTFYQM